MKKRHSAEQIVAKLRQADVELGKGLRVPEVCKQLGISEQTYYRWRTKLRWPTSSGLRAC
jgi:putative transposase